MNRIQFLLLLPKHVMFHRVMYISFLLAALLWTGCDDVPDGPRNEQNFSFSLTSRNDKNIRHEILEIRIYVLSTRNFVSWRELSEYEPSTVIATTKDVNTLLNLINSEPTEAPHNITNLKGLLPYTYHLIFMKRNGNYGYLRVNLKKKDGSEIISLIEGLEPTESIHFSRPMANFLEKLQLSLRKNKSLKL